MDEIAVIARGIGDVAGPSVAEVRRARERLLAHMGSGTRRRRSWPARRWVLVAAVVLVLVTGTALAVGPLGLFRGTPAPDSVQGEIDELGGMFTDEPPPFRVKALQLRPEDATGLFVVPMERGRVLVWSAPLKAGGRCLFFQPVGFSNSRMGFGPCEAPRMSQSPLFYGVHSLGGVDDGGSLITGRVSNRVARLIALYEKRPPQNIRIVEQFFALQYPWWSVWRPSPVALVAYDRSGRVLARSPVADIPNGSAVDFGVPFEYEGMKGLLAADTGAGSTAIVVLRPDDNGCEPAFARSGLGRGPAVARGDFCLGNGAMATGKPHGGEYVTGYAGGNIASVRARLGDGTNRPVLRLDGRFLYAWAEPPRRPGLRPVEIVAEDAAGHVVGILRPGVERS